MFYRSMISLYTLRMVVSVNANLDMEAPVAVTVRTATGEHRWQIANVSRELFGTSALPLPQLLHGYFTLSQVLLGGTLPAGACSQARVRSVNLEKLHYRNTIQGNNCCFLRRFFDANIFIPSNILQVFSCCCCCCCCRCYQCYCCCWDRFYILELLLVRAVLVKLLFLICK